MGKNDDVMKTRAIFRSLVIGSMLLALTCGGCKYVNGGDAIAKRKLTLSYVQNANPCMDVHEAISQNTIFFVGMVEFGTLLPETEHFDKLAQSYPAHFIDGTSDTNPDYEEERALQYAQVFNILMLRHITERPMKETVK